jgi:hypothetical protein
MFIDTETRLCCEVRALSILFHGLTLSVSCETTRSYWAVQYDLSILGKPYIPMARAGNSGSVNTIPEP